MTEDNKNNIIGREYYQANRYKYSSKEKDDSSDKKPIMHRRFYIEGKFSLDGLEDMTKEGWKRLYPRLPEHRTEPEETWVYGDSKRVIIISANYEKDYHLVDISLKNYSEANFQDIEDTRIILEKNLECKLNNNEENKEKLSSGLIDKMKSN